jgi:phospholipid/cholesterol/gamma-HCH transport system permease protein
VEGDHRDVGACVSPSGGAVGGRALARLDDGVRAAGELFGLAVDVLVRLPTAVRRPREVAQQTWFISSVTLVPALLLTISFGLVIGLQVYTITRQFGAESAQGAALVLAIVREAGPLGTTFMMAAAGGTAITADLGSRMVRDEIAALEVMGVDPIRMLVVPRVVAAAIATVLLTGIVIVGGLAGGFAYAVLLRGSNAGAYLQGFSTLAQLSDLVLAMVKAFVFGIIAALVASWKGLTAEGGPTGVGFAVNRSVVLTLLSLVIVNSILTFGYHGIAVNRFA